VQGDDFLTPYDTGLEHIGLIDRADPYFERTRHSNAERATRRIWLVVYCRY